MKQKFNHYNVNNINYPTKYSKKHLVFINRFDERKSLIVDQNMVSGYDIWNAYECSWLNMKGKPEARILQIIYSSDSEFIIESKSLKLYLFSFSLTKFKDEKQVIQTITNDIKAKLNASFFYLSLNNHDYHYLLPSFYDKYLIDNIDLSINIYEYDPNLLKLNKNIEQEMKNQTFVSHLLKTNCPITNQPDYATVYINYYSDIFLIPESLLAYIVSFRNHLGFHESCCDQIFNDIFMLIKPQKLIVKCFFTRRGGIDITPCRFFGIDSDNLYNLHVWRQ